MSYENAPATKMVATKCAVCSRPLVDAKSVETGVGPICRKKYGFDADCSEEDRKEANKLVYQIAAQQEGVQVAENCQRLFELGFSNLVVAILKRIATIKIAVTDDTHPHGVGRLAVVTPYSEYVVAQFRKVPGRRWDRENKLNTFPQSARGQLYGILTKAFQGKTGIGPKGPFVIGQKKEQSEAA